MLAIAAPLVLLLASATSLAQGTPKACSKLPDKPVLSKLPDPFTFFADGEKVRSKADWTCRREEISQLLQRYELGILPPAPDKTVGQLLATDNPNAFDLIVNVTQGETTVSFTAFIRYPAPDPEPVPEDPTPDQEAKGLPAVIQLGGVGLELTPSKYPAIVVNNDAIGQQNGISSRGKGAFFQLYGAGYPAGSMVAWTWGVARIIDVLEKLPESKIDTKRLAITGCSRNGKGALTVGALEPRIALTIPQESGTGGAGCWRIADKLVYDESLNTQTGAQIITENTWLAPAFDSYANKTGTLPFDHHLLQALIAPRGLLVIEHGNIDWLGPFSTYGCAKAASKVWEALGAKNNYGFTQIGDHNHCMLPESQIPDVQAFYEKFLEGKRGPGIFKTDQEFKFNEAEWLGWKAPMLL